MKESKESPASVDATSRASHCYLAYSCGVCDAEDCKLWRVAATSCIELICIECLRAKGHTVDLKASDQVYTPEIEGWSYVPAVPDLNGQWWGYTSVPSWWVEWWKALPNSKHDCTLCKGSGKLAEFDCCFCDGTGAR
jgi:hypothetical protein